MKPDSSYDENRKQENAEPGIPGIASDPEERAAQKAQRRRAWRRRQISCVSMAILLPVFCLILLALLVLPRSKVSNIENRNLASFPEFSKESYLSGEYTEAIADWFCDTVPFRDSLKNASYTLQSLFGISTEDTVTFVTVSMDDLEGGTNLDNAADEITMQAETMQSSEATSENPEGTGKTGKTGIRIIPAGSEEAMKYLGLTAEAADSTGENEEAAEAETEETPEETPAAAEEETAPVEETAEERDYTQEEAEETDMASGMLIVKQDGHWRCLMLYGGGSGTTYATALNYLQEQVGSDVSIYSMPAPIATQYYLPASASDYSNDQESSMQNVAAQLSDSITTVDVFPVLAKHTSEEIYLRTDHHWAPLGAYYACQTFASAAGVPFADLSSYEAEYAEGYVGTLYSFSGDSRILNDPETFVTYYPTVSYRTDYYDCSFDYSYTNDLILGRGDYLTFMGSDELICKVTTSVGNGRKLLIVKDSYGNAEIPFYTSSFDEIYVVDMRYLEANLINMIEDLGITDVLFTMCTYSVVGGNADNLMNLMTQNADVHLTDNAPE